MKSSKTVLTSVLSLLLTSCAVTPSPMDGTQAKDTGKMRPASEKVPATPEAVEQAWVQLARTERAIANDWRNKTFEEFEATVYREPASGKYIVDGDTPIIDRKHLQEFFEKKVQQAGPIQRGLAVMNIGGVDVVWSDTEKRSLTYCVSTGFGTRYNEVVTAMTAAGNAWESVANIDLIHANLQDGNCTATNNQVVFDVRPVNGQPYLARAFFPDDARSDRNVLINDSSFALDPGGNLTLTGILRHELGHTLGFRHEHTRPEAGTCFEDTNWRPLTSYDAFSTMHYPQCNGAGDWSLMLTAQDQSGAACLYGPASGFTIDTSICTPTVEPPEPPCSCSQTVNVSGQVASGEEDEHGPYQVVVGSQFTAQMAGTGDPDLYVRFRQRPTRGSYDCRPYLTGAAETCDLTVPVGATEAFIMVRGFTAGTYNLTIEHTPSSP